MANLLLKARMSAYDVRLDDIIKHCCDSGLNCCQAEVSAAIRGYKPTPKKDKIIQLADEYLLDVERRQGWRIGFEKIAERDQK